jgi:hypothetical protein
LVKGRRIERNYIIKYLKYFEKRNSINLFNKFNIFYYNNYNHTDKLGINLNFSELKQNFNKIPKIVNLNLNNIAINSHNNVLFQQNLDFKN